jgi:hypothetical protein
MANVVRPRLHTVTERQTRLTLSPDAAAHSISSSISISNSSSTRRTSKIALGDDDKPTRTASRKRPATALAADATTPDTRPPTKLTVTQPHGQLLRITNGVPAALEVTADDVPSARSTPRPGSAGKLAPADKRSLRSHDGGSRLKSDLAIYFASYDDIIAGVPKPAGAELLDYDTPIYLVDEPLSPARSRKRKASSPLCDATIPPAHCSTAFHALDYTTIAAAVRNDAAQDPLADAVFFTHHRRAERKEKQLRNIEKERAMHEKLQLERLLDGLQGPDWLKVMGITGVTDGERKDWEPKRDFFVKEVEALVDKFRVWKEEEKRLRAEKEAALAADDEDEEDGNDTEESEPNTSHAHDTAQKPRTPLPRRPPRPHGFLLPLIPPEPATPFQSFYAKPHLRAAALGKHRHGRNATAFGLPIPDFGEKEFDIPDDFVDAQFLRDNARQRRRRKRESKG